MYVGILISCLFLVVPICMAQGGDIINNDGSCGESIYGEVFEDELLNMTHAEKGVVGMVNSGPNTNQSQFYITTVPCQHLDDTNVIVGKVVKGLNIVVEMAEFPREDDKPLKKIWIENCGEFKPGESFNIEEQDGTEDIYPPWPNDWNIEPPNNFANLEKVINSIKKSGNYFYQKGNYIDSERKYVKTLRYIDWYLMNKGAVSNVVLDTLRNTLMLNLAAVKLKRNKYKQALELCNEIIKKDRMSGKAYYRRAQARLGLKDYDKAIDDLNTAVSNIPNDKNVLDLLNKTKKLKLAYLKREKKMFSKMFQ